MKGNGERRVWVLIAGIAGATIGVLGCQDDGAEGVARRDRDGGERVDASHGGSGGTSSKPSGPGTSGQRASGASGSAAGARDASDRDDPVAVTLRFKAKVGEADFECGRSYAELGSSKRTATPNDFRFYVHDIALIATDGSEVPLELNDRAPSQNTEVALIDFADDTGSCFDAFQNTTITGSAPEGTYEGVVFSTSVPESSNHLDYTTAEPPLDLPSMHLGRQSGYAFIRAQLIAGEPTDMEDAGTPLTMVHINSADCTGSSASGFTCRTAQRNRISIRDFDPTEGAIIADPAAAFAQIDLDENVQCHRPAPECRSSTRHSDSTWTPASPRTLSACFEPSELQRAVGGLVVLTAHRLTCSLSA